MNVCYFNQIESLGKYMYLIKLLITGKHFSKTQHGAFSSSKIYIKRERPVNTKERADILTPVSGGKTQY